MRIGSSMPPELIIALRHGEKPADAERGAPLDANGPGIDPRGEVDPSSLTLRGWRRSGALAGTRLCGLLTGVPVPPAVLVPHYGHTERHRSHQTVLALAERLGAAVQDPCEAADVDGLARRVRQADGTVVVCWEHDALVSFAGRLSPEAPAEWPKGRFDVLWLLRRVPGEA